MTGKIKQELKAKVARYKKESFIKRIPQNARVLDVGCGNNSPSSIKNLRKDIYYVGIDVMDYNIDRDDISRADDYIKCDPTMFAQKIHDLGEQFDAVISSHNIEHCNLPIDTLTSICKVIKPKGTLYLAFPAEASIRFPSRKGTLNFYDDSSHNWIPDWNRILEVLMNNNMEIAVAKKQYRPPLLFLAGMIAEPFSIARKKILTGTWAFWGFESVIWARKKD